MKILQQREFTMQLSEVRNLFNSFKTSNKPQNYPLVQNIVLVWIQIQKKCVN